jgi:hypothetical protein
LADELIIKNMTEKRFHIAGIYRGNNLCHSRAGGNPVVFAWIPACAGMTQSLFRFSRQKLFCVFLLLCMGLLFLSGCDQDKKAETKQTEFAVDKEFKKGPLTVHVKVDRNEISIADTLLLRLEATIDETYDLTIPRVAELLNPYELGLLDFQSFPDKLAEENRQLIQREYVLEPIVSGIYTIPEMTFIFTEKQLPAEASGSDAEPTEPHELKTEPIEIEVTSLLDEARGDLTIKDIKGVAVLPMSHKGVWLWILIGVSTVAVIVVVLFFVFRKKKEKLVRIFRPAHEISYERLRKLTEEDLIGKGQIKEFYERISHILRLYIEHRFELHAPERTTEEFLFEVQQSQSLSENHKTTLKNFLEHCDMVKFACYTPSTGEIQKTFDLTKQFIETTRLDQCKIDVTDQVAQPQELEPVRSE